MNTFVTVCVIAAVVIGAQALTDEQKEKIKSYHKDCAAASGIDLAVVQKLKEGVFPDDAKLKEHIYCFSKKAGFQNEAGEIQKEVLRAKLNAEINDQAITDKLIEKCAVQKDTPQNTAFETIKCYFINSEKRIALV